MPRKKRVWYPGAIYHVMNRGNRKDAIFQSEGDYNFFLTQVKAVQTRHPFIVHSICLMPNHFHIQVETENDELAKIMKKLSTTYAMFYNSKYSLSGHLFGGRYRAPLIETDAYFLEVSRYIHLNPVKAKMVKAPFDYEYSSYQLFTKDRETIKRNHILKTIDEIVDTSRILSYFGDDKDQYRRFVEGATEHDEHEKLIMKEMGEDELWLPN
jgi:REP element-mobilizing transposase RayT